ncbi:MAG: hypothetical protein HZA83_01840 [Thaumarchaeota archaeon]|nr:hypothetical protein [Nitrososphaerota archaeon]
MERRDFLTALLPRWHAEHNEPSFLSALNAPMTRRQFGMGAGATALLAYLSGCAPHALHAPQAVPTPDPTPIPAPYVDPIDLRFAPGQGPLLEEMYQVDFDYRGVSEQLWTAYMTLNRDVRVGVFTPGDLSNLETLVQKDSHLRLQHDTAFQESFKYLMDGKSATNTVIPVTWLSTLVSMTEKYGNITPYLREAQQMFGSVSFSGLDTVAWLIENPDHKKTIVLANELLPIKWDTSTLQSDVPLVSQYLEDANHTKLKEFRSEMDKLMTNDEATYILFGIGKPAGDLGTISPSAIPAYLRLAQDPSAVKMLNHFSDAGVVMKLDDAFVNDYVTLVSNPAFIKSASSRRFWDRAESYMHRKSMFGLPGGPLHDVVEALPSLIGKGAERDYAEEADADDSLMNSVYFNLMEPDKVATFLPASFSETDSGIVLTKIL